MTEHDAIARHMAPSPFADCVTAMFFRGVTAHGIAGRYKITAREVAVLINWVCETNARRIPG